MDQEKKYNQLDPPLDWHASPEGSAILPAAHFEPELTVIPLSRAIAKLAGPAVASMLFIMIFNLVDVWWVGKLGAGPLAGVSAASFILWALQSVATLVGSGVNALVAQFVGSKNPRMASLVAGQGLIISVLMAVFFALGGLLYQTRTFQSMGLQGAVLHSAAHYMSYIIAGLPVIFAFFALDAAFRGMGDTRTPLKIVSVSLTLNIILDPFLIFGIGPFPRLGTGGAALATVITHGLGLVWGFFLIRKRDVRIIIERNIARVFHFDLVGRIVQIGAPIAFSGVMFSLSYMWLTRIISRFGSEALAALGLGHRIEGVAYFASVGFAIAAATLVGQNLGAKKPDRAEKAAWLTVFYISLFLAVVSLFYYFAAGRIIRFFITDHSVITEGTRYLRIIALFEIFLGFEVVLEGAFSGAGNSVPPMAISVPLTWLRIPLGLLLAVNLGLGSIGVWWAIASTTALKGLLLAIWFRRGRWKKR